MAQRAGAQTAPASVAEGLGSALRELASTMTAPDAPKFAAPLMQLQSSMLDLIHKTTGSPAAGTPGMPPQGPPGAPGMPGTPGPGAGAGPGAGLALMGGGQGPSAAAGGPSASGSGATADMVRRLLADKAAS